MESKKTFAIGHFSLGYLLGTTSAKILNTRLNMALIFTVSVLPDIDLLLPTFLAHRGPTHSLFFFLFVFLPIFAVYRKKAIPYFIVLLSHSLIGDIYSNMEGIQLFWPISTDWFAIAEISNKSLFSVGFESTLFAVSTVIMVVTKDFPRLIFSKISRIYWFPPFVFVLGPLLLGGISPTYELPFLLVFPSVFYLVIFSLSIIRLNYKRFNSNGNLENQI